MSEFKKENDKKPCRLELLAPAQNKECAYAAIDSGADSVYIGANLFGARKNACNTLEDIEEIINYAHKFGAKIYVTINTILTENELAEAISLIHKLHKIKTDGIIFQDFGILEAANRGELPDIKLIASTQCDNRGLDKAKFFEKIGVGRVILARELSIEKIREICTGTEVEIESFIHGALCVSYSGQCYLSQKIGKRSANKGECAQACRKKYSLVDETGKIIAKDKYLLSLKDFMAKDRLEALVDVGVTSFKIEGRLKDSNYIKNTVSFYRQALDKIIEKRGLKKSSSGKIFLPEKALADKVSPKNFSAKDSAKTFEPDPKKSFNRDFCGYFLDGKRGNIWNFDTPNSVGEFLGCVKSVQKDNFTLDFETKGTEIHPQDGLCFFAKTKENSNLCGMLVNSVQGNKIYPNIMPKIKAGTRIYRNKDAEFENILKNLKPKRQIGVEFRIFDGKIEALDEDKNLVTSEFSTKEKAKNKEVQKEAWLCALQKTGNSDFYIQCAEFLSDEIYFLRKSELNEIRRNILEKLMAQRVSSYVTEKQGKITPAKFPAEFGDYRLNVHNEKAKDFYEKCGCTVLESSYESGRKPFCGAQSDKTPNTQSNETSNTQSSNIQGKKADMQIQKTFKKAELMRTKHCIRYALNMCLKNQSPGLKNNSPKENSSKPDNTKTSTKEPVLFLQDEKGAKYRLCFDCKNCEMVISEF